MSYSHTKELACTASRALPDELPARLLLELLMSRAGAGAQTKSDALVLGGLVR